VFYCIEVQKETSGDYYVDLWGFVDEERFKQFEMGRSAESFAVDEGHCWPVAVPDGRWQSTHMFAMQSEREAVAVAMSAVANPKSAVHDRERLLSSTPVFVTVGVEGIRHRIR